MISFFNAKIAYTAMMSPQWSEYLTSNAIFEEEFLFIFNLNLLQLLPLLLF